jgi:hypothetical protein
VREHAATIQLVAVVVRTAPGTIALTCEVWGAGAMVAGGASTQLQVMPLF